MSDLFFGEFSHLKKSIDDVSMELNDMQETEWVGFSHPTDSLTDHLLEYDDVSIRELNDDPELMAWLDEHLEESNEYDEDCQRAETAVQAQFNQQVHHEQSPRLVEGITCIKGLSQRVFPMKMSIILARIHTIHL